MPTTSNLYLLWLLSLVTLTYTRSSHSTYQISCPFTFFRSYHRISQSPKQLWTFRNMTICLQWGAVNTSPKPKAGGPPFVCCPRLLIQFIRSYPPYLWSFLHPQPEEAPCRGYRDPLCRSLLKGQYNQSLYILMLYTGNWKESFC